jgi:replicative DNA helicase
MEKGILVVSLEMPASQIIDRLVARIGDISMRALAEGLKTEREMAGMQKALTALSKSHLVVRDDLHDVASIVATARAMAKQPHGLGVLLVDYIQLVRCELGRDGTREREVAEVSRALRLIGLELGCLVIGITQLNEQGKARESRAIQQDATCILAIRLPEEDKDPESAKFRDVTIPYQRNGPCGVKTSLRFNGRTASFHND